MMWSSSGRPHKKGLLYCPYMAVGWGPAMPWAGTSGVGNTTPLLLLVKPILLDVDIWFMGTRWGCCCRANGLLLGAVGDVNAKGLIPETLSQIRTHSQINTAGFAVNKNTV